MGILNKEWKEYDEGSWAIRDDSDELEVRSYERDGKKKYGWAYRQCGVVLVRGELDTLLAAQKVAKEAYKTREHEIVKNWANES